MARKAPKLITTDSGKYTKMSQDGMKSKKSDMCPQTVSCVCH